MKHSLSAALLRGVMLHGDCPRRQAALALGASGPYELGRGQNKKSPCPRWIASVVHGDFLLKP
ncbi:hypothetical protein [Paenibacillus sp. 276b]|uniref:hypothetical protein n=1 Tax=Paenibacillus sp. 276b TaxID=1566277 RepID=UPI000AC036B6|nr:hypothetical protein [Paenibacillus sp. 276b]